MEEKSFTDTAHADTVYPHSDNAEAMAKFGKIFDPTTKDAEAMPESELEFLNMDTAHADTVAPDMKNMEAMPESKMQLVIQLVSENIEGFTKQEVKAAK